VLGTPAIVYNVPGLRDSTRDGETGLVCQENHPSALAQAVASLHADAPLYARVRHRAWAMARELSWDQTARAAWDAVEACLVTAVTCPQSPPARQGRAGNLRAR